MTVGELIAQLMKLPQDQDVKMLWDGAARSDVEIVYVAKGRYIVLAPLDEPCYNDDDRPEDAPLSTDNRHWYIGEKQ